MTKRIRVLFRLASLAALAALPLLAESPLAGPEFQVNTYTEYGQYNASIDADSTGNFIIVWTSDRQDGAGAGIFGQRYNPRGTAQGDEFQINTETFSQQTGSAVAVAGTGNFVVVWSSYTQDGSQVGVFGQRFNSMGVAQGGEFPVNTYTTQSQGDSDVAADSAGNFVVVWSSYGQDGSGEGVFGQRFNAVGVTQGDEFPVNTYVTGFQSIPRVAMDGAGNFVVIWSSTQPQDDSRGVFGRRYNAAGVAQTGEFLINTYTTGSQAGASIDADGAGNFVVVWDSYLQDGSNYSVFGQRFSSSGIPQGGEFQVNTYTTGYQASPDVSMSPEGDFVVVWNSLDQDGDSYGVFGQSFDASGATLFDEFQINTYTTNKQEEPAVAGGGLGIFVVAWRSYLQDGSYHGVFAQRGAWMIFTDGFESGDTTAWSHTVP